jgi:membrane protein
MLLLGATAVFAQLQDALNTIWRVKPREGRAWLGVIKDRFWTFMIVLSIGFLLLGSLLISIGLSAVTEFLPAAYHPNLYFWRALDWLVSFGLVTTLFAMIYKLLPDVELEWRDVWVGAAVTAVLFTIGRYLIGLYLAHSSWISAYGAAGSLVIVLLWVYYSSQVFLFGAEFTYVWANESGKPLVPRANAEPATEEARARQETPQSCLPAHEDA